MKIVWVYTSVAQSTITGYIEKLFLHTLDKASQTAMHKVHPMPKTEATRMLKVDCFMIDYLVSQFPKSVGNSARIQMTMLHASGLMTCPWTE